MKLIDICYIVDIYYGLFFKTFFSNTISKKTHRRVIPLLKHVEKFSVDVVFTVELFLKYLG